MRELNVQDLELIGGGVQLDKVGAGLGAIAIGTAAAVATPASVPVAIGATVFTFQGGVAVGDGLREGNVIERTIGVEKSKQDKSGNNYGH